MRVLSEIIEDRRIRYLDHPFIRMLRDPQVSPERRLAYAPYTAHFVLSFSDINRRFLADESTPDPAQKIVNEHAAEDARHWRWFLSDLRVLGHDPDCRLTDALHFLWGDGGWHVRDMSYYAASVASRAQPRERLAIIEALEAMGKVWLESTLIAARDHPKADELIYFGQHHLDRETGHAIGSDEDEVQAIEFSEDERAELTPIIHGLFDRMERMNTEILARTLAEEPLLPRS